MITTHIGEFASLGVAVCWTISALYFQKAGNNIGSLSVNFIRLAMAFGLLGLTTLFTRSSFLPLDATSHEWFWLGLSGFIGFFVGDLFLFKSYSVIGSRTAALIMSFAPLLTAIIGWIFLSEILSGPNIVAIAISLSGIVVAIANRKMQLNIPFKGFMYAFGGALGQAVGLLLSKKGMELNYDPIAGTQIRAIFGLISFVFLITYLKRWPVVKEASKHKSGMKSVLVGSFFGPFVGVALSLFAIQQTKIGIASTLMSFVPILIIWPSAIMFNEKIKVQHVIGAIISLVGVSLFFM